MTMTMTLNFHCTITITFITMTFILHHHHHHHLHPSSHLPQGENLLFSEKEGRFKLIDFGGACDLVTKTNYREDLQASHPRLKPTPNPALQVSCKPSPSP